MNDAERTDQALGHWLDNVEAHTDQAHVLDVWELAAAVTQREPRLAALALTQTLLSYEGREQVASMAQGAIVTALGREDHAQFRTTDPT